MTLCVVDDTALLFEKTARITHPFQIKGLSGCDGKSRAIATVSRALIGPVFAGRSPTGTFNWHSPLGGIVRPIAGAAAGSFRAMLAAKRPRILGAGLCAPTWGAVLPNGGLALGLNQRVDLVENLFKQLRGGTTGNQQVVHDEGGSALEP